MEGANRDEQVVEVDEFETTDPALRGEMTMTITLIDADGGIDVIAAHDDLPAGLSPTDNATGWHVALAQLAALVKAEMLALPADDQPGKAH